MKATTLVPVEEYLRTSYRPDCDYVDGEVLERNVGEHDHSDLQTELAYYFRARRKQWRLHAVVEQRVQIKAEPVSDFRCLHCESSGTASGNFLRTAVYLHRGSFKRRQPDPHAKPHRRLFEFWRPF